MSKCYYVFFIRALFIPKIGPQSHKREIPDPKNRTGPTQNIYYVTPNSFLPLNMVKIVFSLAAIFIFCSHRIQYKFYKTKPYK